MVQALGFSLGFRLLLQLHIWLIVRCSLGTAATPLSTVPY